MKNLKLTKQCKNCPWKKSTDPHDIPNGYSLEKHKELKKTTVQGDNVEHFFRNKSQLNAMACHCSTNENEFHCVGWLHNQLGVGNNIAVRLMMMQYSNAKDIEVIGEQHGTIEETFPK